ncbi:hypothetical protein LPJ61_002890 [Coemansia biformis]|uniref:Zn(2)-C6 fungal-type domain-containing protein n=1 Tax=Coemansia biformis TaxID=1286918 RepID=A0A9W8CYR3_9FUNG|nr:hypothetical protein LPJ61_002890 [Coemansia biformis]
MPLDPLSVPFLRSCERCRTKKRKCSGEKPACAWCRSHSIPCRYRRTMRFNRQLEDAIPPHSIAELTAPVILSKADRPVPPTGAAPPDPALAAGPTLGQTASAPMPTTAPAADSACLSVDALARLFSVDMVPQSGPPAREVLLAANSFISSLHPMALPAAPDWAAVTNTEASVLANLGGLAASSRHMSLQDWAPVGFDDACVGGADVEGLPPPMLGGEWLPATGADLALAGLGDLLPPQAAGSAATPLSEIALPAMVASPSSHTQGAFSSERAATCLGAAGGWPGAAPAAAGQMGPGCRWNSYTLPPAMTSGSHGLAGSTPSPRARSQSAAANTPAAPTDESDNVPRLLKEYVAPIPGRPPSAAIYTIMRETFRAPRMGMLALNLELLWYMLHKGVLPRIAFYGHIASTIRCSTTGLDIKSMVPPNIDESCYELALSEVPLVKDSAAIWGAIGLCMVTRYEFQSSRYKEMAEHADMALDILRRIDHHGHSFPWHSVAADAKEGFEYQYLIAIYWKCFLWKVVSLLLIEENPTIDQEFNLLPDYSSKSFDLYACDKPYDIDLVEMLPPGSWPSAGAGAGAGAGDSPSPLHIRFRGPSDPDFMGLRPARSPSFGGISISGAYMQHLLVIQVKFLALQCQARQGTVGLGPLLRALWQFRERMDAWWSSLPPELVLDRGLVADYMAAIGATSTATSREIDLKALHLKEVISLFLTYHMGLVRANRFVMKAMLGERLDVPPPDVSTMAFAIRDLYDSQTSPKLVTDGLGIMNMHFHSCRMQAVRSTNALCSILQTAYACKFSFYTLGLQVVFAAFEVLTVHFSFLGNCDEYLAWRAKSRLANAFNILRMLRHWAPALHIFVAGVRALSDPRFCLNEPQNFDAAKQEAMRTGELGIPGSPLSSQTAAGNDDGETGDGDGGDASGDNDDVSMPRKRRHIAQPPWALEPRGGGRAGTPAPGVAQWQTEVRRDETLGYRAPDPIPEFPNPFPSNHVISQVIRDLGLSLAEFLAPSFPILLLKLMSSPGVPLGGRAHAMFGIPYLTSCNHCREKKRKCNGERPACSLCRAHNVTCEYRRSRRFRKRTEGVVAASQASSIAIHAILPSPESRFPQPAHARALNPLAPRPIVAASRAADSAGNPAGAAAGPAATGALSGPVQPGPKALAQPTQPHFQNSTPQLPSEAQALTRLLAGDMFPQTQQLPQPILQGVNMFMSPFSDARSQAIPEWISQQKPEADIISNLENIASAYPTSTLAPLQTGTALDSALLGSLTSQLMQGGAMYQPYLLGISAGQPMSTQFQQSGVPVSQNGALAIHNILAPPPAGLAVSSGSGYGGAAYAQKQLGASAAVAHVGGRAPSLARSTGSHEAEAGWAGSPGSGRNPNLHAYGMHSPGAGAGSSASTPLDSMHPSPTELNKRFSTYHLSSNSAQTYTAMSNGRTQLPPQTQQPPSPPLRQQRPSAGYPDDFVPDVIQRYASEFPAPLSPQVLLKVMRGICSTTRTSLVNVDLELSWCMILKGIIPRIQLFAYIASMARGQAIDPELMPLLPEKFDELCYEAAIRDVPLAVASPCLWGALSLHLIGRYEFQSARYDLMMQHYEMAYEIFTKLPFHGYPFPWNDTPERLKRTFEYDYYVYTFWAGFQWHVVSSLSLDRPFNINMDRQMLPIPTCTQGYFAPGLPCELDLLTLLPRNSWPRTEQTRGVTEVWFRGFDDPEFEGWRPAAWREIKPNYQITVHLQRMLPLGAQLYRLQYDFSSKHLSLADYLQQLHTQQELLKRWLYSLPESFELTLAKVTKFTGSEAARRSPCENRNLIMDFKELIMTYALYSTFMIRANRVALLGMLGEDVTAPATSMDMRVFGLRDYLDAPEREDGARVGDFGAGASSKWQKNLAFHKYRMHCYEAIDVLCDVVQLNFILQLDLFTYGTTFVAIAGEMLNVLISQLGIEDRQVKWGAKTRLGHVLCLLRSLQHWAPALYLFVYGIQALCDPSLVLEPEESDEVPATGRSSRSDRAPAADSDMKNPFPRNHIINLIVDDLDVSLATFIAPAYPVLLLKIFASNS